MNILFFISLFDFPSCFVEFRSTVTAELQCPREENSCLNRRNRHCKEQGKIDVVYFTGDLVIFFARKIIVIERFHRDVFVFSALSE